VSGLTKLFPIPSPPLIQSAEPQQALDSVAKVVAEHAAVLNALIDWSGRVMVSSDDGQPHWLEQKIVDGGGNTFPVVSGAYGEAVEISPHVHLFTTTVVYSSDGTEALNDVIAIDVETVFGVDASADAVLIELWAGLDQTGGSASWMTVELGPESGDTEDLHVYVGNQSHSGGIDHNAQSTGYMDEDYNQGVVRVTNTTIYIHLVGAGSVDPAFSLRCIGYLTDSEEVS